MSCGDFYTEREHLDLKQILNCITTDSFFCSQKNVNKDFAIVYGDFLVILACWSIYYLFKFFTWLPRCKGTRRKDTSDRLGVTGRGSRRRPLISWCSSRVLIHLESCPLKQNYTYEKLQDRTNNPKLALLISIQKPLFLEC